MKRSYGFTLIELLITITIMVILMTLAVVSLRSTQANARDNERATDVENIARGLEIRYAQGNDKVLTTPPGWTTKGSYPGNNEFLHATGWDWCANKADVFQPCFVTGNYLTHLLPGTTDSSFHAPGTDNVSLFSMWGADEAKKQEFLADGYYVYAPFDKNNGNCYDADCVKFTLYYKSEVDNQVHTIKSKHQ